MPGSFWMSKHAAERFMERRIPLREIEKMLKEGVRAVDPQTNSCLCIYKHKSGGYFTLVLDDLAEPVTIITAYESSVWQIGQYKKVKKNGAKKVR